MLFNVKKTLSMLLIVCLINGLLVLPIPGTVYPLQAQTRGVCEKNLAEAEEKYNSGRFDEAIALIRECLGKTGLSEQEKMKAYRLLGLNYIAKDYLDEARLAVKKLLDMVPNYQTDPIQDPPPFTRMVEEEKQKQPTAPPKTLKAKKAEKKGASKKWYIIGGTAIVALVAAILIVTPPPEKTIADPPGRP